MPDPVNSGDSSRRALHGDLIAAARGQHEAAENASTDSMTLTSPGPSFTLPSDDSFAGYQILREIHRGGQGVVFQALQKSTNRKVAIKVMREGPFAASGDQARFDREVQILGQLKHPNIVTIHDTGVAAGCHYFVMDYISGQPLDVHMASGPRSIDETLRLFAKICEAVNAAHLRGIIHRDLKPGNIRIDSNGEPHVLDFGLAKVAVSDADAAAMTMTGQFVGSVPWASPEQAEGSHDKIDVRTDVYSLGVILYQMLTAKFPYEVVGHWRDVLDRVMRSAPVRPRTIRRDINDEVETIVLKCLSKERERRYQSAGELARDVERYLRGEPIEAKRESFRYLFRKAVQRHRAAFSVVAAFGGVVAAALVISVLFWRQAEAAAERAEHEAERADAVASFMNEILRSSRPAQLVDALDRGVVYVAYRFENDPLTEASVRDSIGLGYRSLGRLSEAETQVRTALGLWRAHAGAEHLAAISSMINLAVTLRDRGTLERSTEALNEAEAIYNEAVTLSARALGSDDPRTLAARHNLAELLSQRGEYVRAEEIYRGVLAARRRLLGDGHPDTLVTMQSLASLLTQRRKFDEAEHLLRDATAQIERLPENQPLRLDVLQNQAYCYVGRGEPLRAAPMLDQAAAMSQRIYGRHHAKALEAMRELARCEYDLGRLDLAREHISWVVDEQRDAKIGDYELLRSENVLAAILLEMGDISGASPIITHARRIAESATAMDDPIRLIAISNEVGLLRATQQWEAAERLCREVLEARRAALGERHPHVVRSLHDLGTLLAAQGKHSLAEPFLRQAVTAALDDLSPGSWLTGTIQLSYAESLRALGRGSEARLQLSAAFDTLRRSLGESHSRTKRAQSLLEAPD